MGDYLRPDTLEQALAALRAGPRVVLAGGTDYFPARVGRPLDDDILDITAIEALTGITDADDHIRIGALVRWSDLEHARLPRAFDGLKTAARQIGGVQVQNAGTVCGNVCNASPAADGTPNLLVLDAEVELASGTGVRRLPVADFVAGNRETLRQPAELVTGLLVPKPPDTARSCFHKLGARAYLVISIVIVAGLLIPADDGTVAEARVAVGACSPVPRRLEALEAALRGQPIGDALAALPAAEHVAQLTPIDDVRGTAAYRRDATLTLLRRAIGELCAEAAA